MTDAAPQPLSAEIRDYLLKVTHAFPEIASVWLIGSRANGTTREDSDWDFLLFASPAVLEGLRQNDSFSRPDVDLLVVTDGNRFESPWQRTTEGTGFKGGHLFPFTFFEEGLDFEDKGWEWDQTSPDTAVYVGSKKWVSTRLKAYMVSIEQSD